MLHFTEQAHYIVKKTAIKVPVVGNVVVVGVLSVVVLVVRMVMVPRFLVRSKGQLPTHCTTMWDKIVREPNGVGKQQQAGNYDLFDLHCLAKVAKRTCNGVAGFRPEAPMQVVRAKWG